MIAEFEKSSCHVPFTLESLSEFAGCLKESPGKWALLGHHGGSAGGARTYAWSIRYRHHDLPGRAFGPGFEVEARTMLGEHRVYVRYVG